ncbi:pyruvate dehydrogenase complex dihydrolipoyllysine-residue acetyltransferase [Acinetobacter pittii]|jgi:pyruvate dehydrogenase E2 component (dihydrolipoamide acetyltransferase)|uniref:Dihydrolipoamide acetyltransferase component of pyruvate dehydrogenase complex n=1 Tax=Acinetobacter pittii TaxID=48296 RepID=K9CI96_ACIPI|nr:MULTISPECIES: 2-oxo acid dehydrogenase subunit E2 [Acinetobacter]AVN16826.1 pyruvate dehydrogenase complex dihydrolipoyllysine-residue acetyltransferase [Acinetobacter pittii]EKU66532.1 dihydrolipoyllysine-residue acetyltransferase [Acinetobacter pittii]ENW15058.1 dihydrolipoyllysine-residue acetyltransferase [Acinetobacter pittii ATCC 19004 = CIP 70.29]EXE92304.1 dihydrolipoyllysine-residue acetyltransferase [Acinetobacter sp. 1578804]EXG30448.1 dihydrolipoyllysine-residue acetyltransferas
MQIKTPDIGVDKAVVAEILVKVGDSIAENDSLVLLESDKASVEVPSTSAGVVKSILIKEGDSVTEGTVLLELEAEGAAPVAQAEEAPKAAPAAEQTAAPAAAQQPSTAAQPATATTSQVVEVQVPDIGVEKALVGEILVKVGEQIDVEQSIVVVESDKATVEVPSSVAGTVESIQVKEGDTVKEGVVLIKVKTTSASSAPAEAPASTTAAPAAAPAPTQQETVASTATQSGPVDINVPDLGVDKAVVAEILVQVGDKVDVDQSLVVVESDKATVEVPSTVAGVVKAIHLQAGQQVSQGVLLATIEAEGQAPAAAPAAKAESAPAPQAAAPKAAAPAATQSAPVASTSGADKLTKEQEAENAKVYAGPAVRKLARELGVVLSQVKTSGEHGRVVKEDIFAYVKSRLTAPQAAPVAAAAPAVSGLPKLPDFTAFGGVEEKVLTRLQQVSIPQLSLNNFIPQVTQFDLADITELEDWRNELKGNFKKEGISLTIMAFIIKAVAYLLKEEREFAGHLSDDGKSVLLRNEIHMGIAVATPDGLTVPVLRNPDQKSIKQIAVELGMLGQKARDKKLTPKDLQGANFTISSLGAIGGTAFTPLVNWPQVAILGISPATMQPVWNGKDFDPRLMLPLSLSYDHRVINGADAARFTNKLTKLLKDIRTLLI